MDPIFQVTYQTIDETKKLRLQSENRKAAQARAEAFLKEKYGGLVTILSIEQESSEPLWKQITDKVVNGTPHRQDSESESEAIELERAISEELLRRRLDGRFWAIRFKKAVHVFPVNRVKKGSEQWKRMTGNDDQDMGRYGRDR